MRMKKALFCFFLFTLVCTAACSEGKKETNVTDSEQSVTSALTKEDLITPEVTAPAGDKGIGSSEGDVVGKGDSLEIKEPDKEENEEGASKAPLRKKNNITRTIMVYIVGSDLESGSGAASKDILEMMDSGVDLSKNNVLVYTGGTNEWWLTAIPSSRNVVYELCEEGFVPVKEQMSLNMGDSYTLESFLKYGKKNYPADQFGLILWNHGGGPMLGYGVDEQTGDLLEMSEIAAALNDSGFKGKDKLEFLGFDACLMGSVETGWNVKDNAKYLIASQETEPSWGWNYEFLKELRYCADGAEIGKEIIDYYMEAGDEIFEENPYLWSDLTLSCMDLTKITALEEAIDALYEEVVPDLSTGYFTKASRARTKTKSFGQFSSGNSYDLADLGDMVTFLKKDYKEESADLQDALDDFVCYSQTNVKDATGVSIFYPYENRDCMSYWVELYEEFGFAPNYTEYISMFAEMLSKPRSSAWSSMRNIQSSAVKQEDSSLMTFQLTPEQQEDYAYSQYVILKKTGDDEYIFVVNSDDTTIDDAGLVSASYNNRVVYAVSNQTGEYSTLPIPMKQVKDGTSKDRYTSNAVLYGMSNVDAYFSKMEVGEIQFVLGETPEMYGIYLVTDEDNLFPAKNLLDYREFDVIDVGAGIRKPVRDENGELKPFDNWSGNSGVQGTSLVVSDGFRFEYQDVSGEDEYYYMFQVYDLQGNCTVSELFPLPTKEATDSKPVVKQESLMETEREDYENLIQGVTVKTAEAFGKETQIELSDKPDDFTFRLDGYTYELPMPLSYLTETGWIFYSWCDFGEINLTPGDYKKAYMHKNGKTLQIEVFNPSGKNEKFKDCIVGRLTFEFPTETELALAKDIVVNTISIDDVITSWGNPNNVAVTADGKSVDLEYNVGYSELLTTNYSNYKMRFSVETKQLESLVMANYKEEEDVSGKEDTEYLKDYEAPEELGEEVLSWNVQLLGDVYTLPAPVSAFTENGWEIVLAQNVKAGKELEQGIIMQKDGVVVAFSVFNFSEYQTNAANATVYKLSQRGDEIGTWHDLQLLLPGNISIGMTEEAFLKLLEKDELVMEAFSLYEYEYGEKKYTTYEYADSMTANMEFEFVDGILDEITMYNKKCGYRNKSGEILTKSW